MNWLLCVDSAETEGHLRIDHILTISMTNINRYSISVLTASLNWKHSSSHLSIIKSIFNSQCIWSMGHDKRNWPIQFFFFRFLLANIFPSLIRKELMRMKWEKSPPHIIQYELIAISFSMQFDWQVNGFVNDVTPIHPFQLSFELLLRVKH